MVARALPTVCASGKSDVTPLSPSNSSRACYAPGPAHPPLPRMRNIGALFGARPTFLIPTPIDRVGGTLVQVKRIHVTTGSSVRGEGGEERRREPFGR